MVINILTFTSVHPYGVVLSRPVPSQEGSVVAVLLASVRTSGEVKNYYVDAQFFVDFQSVTTI